MIFPKSLRGNYKVHNPVEDLDKLNLIHRQTKAFTYSIKKTKHEQSFSVLAVAKTVPKGIYGL